MAEYIERKALIRDLIDRRNFFPAIVKRAIEEAPAADVKEVRRGRWMGLHDGWHYSYSCSECGAEALTKEETMHDQVCSNYCPYCGARMDGKGDV